MVVVGSSQDKLDLAVSLGADIVVNGSSEDPVEIAKEFTRGYGMDAAIMCFGGDSSEAFKLVVQMLKKSPDTHVMGRTVFVSGSFAHGFGAIEKTGVNGFSDLSCLNCVAQ